MRLSAVPKEGGKRSSGRRTQACPLLKLFLPAVDSGRQRHAVVLLCVMFYSMSQICCGGGRWVGPHMGQLLPWMMWLTRGGALFCKAENSDFGLVFLRLSCTNKPAQKGT